MSFPFNPDHGLIVVRTRVPKGLVIEHFQLLLGQPEWIASGAK